MIREITQLGNPVLRAIAQPIANAGAKELQVVIADLIETMTSANGVGIAAPQVGESLRVFIVASRPNDRYPNAPLMEPVAMINPEIVTASAETAKDWEGCLSIPGIRGLVPRHTKIDVRYTDAATGQVMARELTYFVARIFQHELDHLNGIVFLDRVESSKEIITDQEYKRLLKK